MRAARAGIGCAVIGCAALLAASPALAMDLNAFRAANGKPALAYGTRLSAMAQQQAAAMAGRGGIDHKDFHRRASWSGSTMAENVGYGCDDESCAIARWARSSGHRSNMLRGDVTHYGLAYSTGANGRRYWALELGSE